MSKCEKCPASRYCSDVVTPDTQLCKDLLKQTIPDFLNDAILLIETNEDSRAIEIIWKAISILRGCNA